MVAVRLLAFVAAAILLKACAVVIGANNTVTTTSSPWYRKELQKDATTAEDIVLEIVKPNAASAPQSKEQ